jgi:PLD-like domain
MSQLLTGQDVWPTLRDLTNTRTGRAWCAIAYVGVNADSWLDLRAGDTLVCDASDGAVRLGMTSAAQLRRWVEAGVAVFSRAGMHAKIGALSRWAFVGSANASDSSATSREEAVLLTADAETRKQVREYVKGLQRAPSRVVDLIELQRLDLIAVRAPRWPKIQPRFQQPIPERARLQMWNWGWDQELTPEEKIRAEDGVKDLAVFSQRSNRVEVMFEPTGSTHVLPVEGDVFCWRDDTWTYAPAPVLDVVPDPAGGRPAVFYLVRADLHRLRTDDVERVIAAADPEWKVSTRLLSLRATRAIAALDWATSGRAKP